MLECTTIDLKRSNGTNKYLLTNVKNTDYDLIGKKFIFKQITQSLYM